MNFSRWELWYADFPFEETLGHKDRPVLILSVEPLAILSVKITKHDVRTEDEFDVPITRWREAGLVNSSTARISKTMNLPISNFRRKIGDLHDDDKQHILQAYTDYLIKSGQVKIESESENSHAANE